MSIRKKNKDDLSIQVPMPKSLHEMMVKAAGLDRRTRKDFVLLSVEERAKRIIRESEKGEE